VDGSQVSAFEAGADVFAVSFTPDGAQLVFGDMFGKLPVLDFRAGRVVRSLDGAALHKLDRLQDVVGLRGLAFSKDGKKLIAAGLLPKNGGTVQGNPMLLYFDFASGVLEQSFTHGEPKDGHIEDVALTADGNVIAVASGTPGNGLLFIHRQGEKTPSFVSTKLANCLSIALHPGERQFVVTSTNKASSGNGRRLTKEGEYLGNNSPVHLFEFPV
jgi:WD40 repeat protein